MSGLPWMYGLFALCLLAALAVKYMEFKEGQNQSQNKTGSTRRHWRRVNEHDDESTEAAANESSRPILSKKCASCGATLDIHDQFCKYCGSAQNIVKKNGYSYSEQIVRKIDEAKIKEIEYKKEELKHTEKWWQKLLFFICISFVFMLPFFLIMLMVKFFLARKTCFT